MAQKNTKYSDAEKLHWWREKLKEYEMQIRIAKVRIEHLEYKLRGQLPADQEEDKSE